MNIKTYIRFNNLTNKAELVNKLNECTMKKITIRINNRIVIQNNNKYEE